MPQAIAVKGDHKDNLPESVKLAIDFFRQQQQSNELVAVVTSRLHSTLGSFGVIGFTTVNASCLLVCYLQRMDFFSDLLPPHGLTGLEVEGGKTAIR